MEILFKEYLRKDKYVRFIRTDNFIIFPCLKNDSSRIVADLNKNVKINACNYCKECEYYYIVENYYKNNGIFNFDNILINKRKKAKKKKIRDIKFDSIKRLINELNCQNSKIKITDSFYDKYVDKEIFKNRQAFISTLKQYAKKSKVLNVESKKRKGTYIILRRKK